MSPLAHALTRSLGHEKKAQPALRSVLVLEEGDGVLLMSDGVTDVLRPEHLAEALAVSPNPAAAIEEIYSRAFEGGSKDNIPVIFLSAGRPYLVGSRLPQGRRQRRRHQPNLRPNGDSPGRDPAQPRAAPGAAFTLARVLAAAWVSAFFRLRELPVPREADGAPDTTAPAPRPLPTLAGAPPEEEVALEPASPLETRGHEDAGPRVVPALVPAAAPSGAAPRTAAASVSAASSGAAGLQPVATVAPLLHASLPGTGAGAPSLRDHQGRDRGSERRPVRLHHQVRPRDRDPRAITLVSMRFVPSGLTLRQPGAGFPIPSCSISATAVTCTTPVEPDDRRPKGDGSDLLELSLRVGDRPSSQTPAIGEYPGAPWPVPQTPSQSLVFRHHGRCPQTPQANRSFFRGAVKVSASIPVLPAGSAAARIPTA
jgi:sulfur transfer complex TusBCD TusB component (DsrH family)